jgi:hypothetical protein
MSADTIRMKGSPSPRSGLGFLSRTAIKLCNAANREVKDIPGRTAEK